MPNKGLQYIAQRDELHFLIKMHCEERNENMNTNLF